ncbi:MAG: hypothetical protein KHW59_06240 [Clostridiales bacterium]|nr:hypothetical protein [Clostridiales bacterium]
MDMTNMLRRRGKPYAIAAGPHPQSDVVGRAGRLAQIAAGAASLAGSRVGTVGGSFDGMGDFLISDQELLERFGGKVPDNMEDLTSLPGVGRKTANLILGDVYGQPSYVCDTHCIRITGRLGITDGSKDPVKVEQQLRKAIPPAESGPFCHRMVLFGRDVCTARSPQCEDCPLKADCAQGKKLK